MYEHPEIQTLEQIQENDRQQQEYFEALTYL